jgi:hypothetical protein
LSPKESAVANRMKLSVAFAVVLGCLALHFQPAPAFANNPNLACQLAPDNVVTEAFGLHFHALWLSRSGISEKLGSFTSSCDFLVYRKKPKQGVNPIGGPPHFRVRKNFGSFLVLTTEQDEGAEGEEWNPDEINTLNLAAFDGDISEFGGGQIPMPGFGFKDVHAFWIANRKYLADAYWRADDDGFIELELHSHEETDLRLRYLAEHIVPHFHP